MTNTTLVLFDIDGTLIHTQRAGIRGMNAAFAQLHGNPTALDGIAIAGRTDRAIVSEALRNLGFDASSDAIRSVRDVYFEHLPLELTRRTDGPYGVLPGVLDMLHALDHRPNTTVALLTGNFVGGAVIKLGHFDLWQRFAFGAFGDEHLDRRDLVPVAVARAEEAGLSPSRVIVIGDTPLDIDCARAHGACAVAVATGIYSRDSLVEAGAHVAVETLADLAVTGAWIDG